MLLRLKHSYRNKKKRMFSTPVCVSGEAALMSKRNSFLVLSDLLFLIFLLTSVVLVGFGYQSQRLRGGDIGIFFLNFNIFPSLFIPPAFFSLLLLLLLMTLLAMLLVYEKNIYFPFDVSCSGSASVQSEWVTQGEGKGLRVCVNAFSSFFFFLRAVNKVRGSVKVKVVPVHRLNENGTSRCRGVKKKRKIIIPSTLRGKQL
uniref:Uncharacterized protein TCIL3000_11_7180 n=1 Tax=Trypanosoma congolense (strain IL3000) TaxID=1068625 RepID=G0V0W7_TRYCI|nr:unnamed protein product [Trypanosoma congolense IL3000]